MNKMLSVGLFLGLMASASLALAAGGSDGRRDEKIDAFRDAATAAQRYQVMNPAEAAGEGGPPDAILVVTPQYHYVDHDNLTTGTLAPFDLKSQGGSSKTGTIGFAYVKPVNETLNLTFAYQYAYTDYSGGVLVPKVGAYDQGVRGETEQQIDTNIIGLIGDINLKDYGRLNLSVVQGFDNISGYEQVVAPDGNVVDKRSLDTYRQRVTALMAWYEIDAGLSESVTLTPYIGWRSLYAHLTNQNTGFGDSSLDGEYNNAHAWIHLGTLGAKLNCLSGPWSFGLRGGVNHRFSKDDLPGFANRAIAPGVVQLGYNVNFDETVGTFGAGVTRAFDFGALSLNYDGFAGSQTTSHQVAVTAVFAF